MVLSPERMPTSVASSRESYIPVKRQGLIEVCVADNRLKPDEVIQFRSFCEILAAYQHFQFHRLLEIMKSNYASLNPMQTHGMSDPSLSPSEESRERAFVQTFRQILAQANYQEFSRAELQKSLDAQSLVALKTEVDFGDFKQIACFYQGDINQTLLEKKLFRQTVHHLDILKRLVLMIQFQGDRYFEDQDIKPQDLNFIPGKIYLYFYKDVPKQDIELLFPNVRTRMTLKDRLLLIIPGLGAGIAVGIKVLPQLLLIVGVLLFLLDAPVAFETLKAKETDAQDLMPVILAILSLLMALGGFGFKQYSNYKSKKIAFQKKVSDTLFFRNIANHSAVFQMLVDIAEEEECKEIILAYYHLLVTPQPLTVSELDTHIEQWMQAKLNATVDFDIKDAIEKMESIRVDSPSTQLLTQDKQGYCQVLSLPQAKELLDTIWDRIFEYGV